MRKSCSSCKKCQLDFRLYSLQLATSDHVLLVERHGYNDCSIEGVRLETDSLRIESSSVGNVRDTAWKACGTVKHIMVLGWWTMYGLRVWRKSVTNPLSFCTLPVQMHDVPNASQLHIDVSFKKCQVIVQWEKLVNRRKGRASAVSFQAHHASHRHRMHEPQGVCTGPLGAP